MTMQIRTAVGALGAALTLLAPSAAVAAPTAGPSTGTTVSAPRLVLTPDVRGYQGELPITVTNRGDSPSVRLLITEPVAGSWNGTVSNEFCMTTVPISYQRTFECWLSVPPGASSTVTARFEVLTRPRPYAMSTDGGRIALRSPDVAKPFRTVFRSTTGSVRHPRAYRPDTRSRASIEVGEARLTRQSDGRWAGWLPVTVGYRGDAPHNRLVVASTVPTGVDLTETDPVDLPVFADGFTVPGGRFAAGERRSFRVKVTAPKGTAPGPLGVGEFVVGAGYEGGDVPEATPRNNVASFPIIAVDAS
ncbi:hypothetical protein [Micromonospora sp. NPDC049282]|uniref:hypothetical protein n=1 Tax=Micromonospora sp. NPDC049282 TaxID=3364269 RepID=UPI0037155A3F